MSKGLAAGISLCFLALLGGLFVTKSYHKASWPSRAVFIPITLLGMLSPLPVVALQTKEVK